MARLFELTLNPRNTGPTFFIQNTDPAIADGAYIRSGTPWIQTENDAPPWGLVLAFKIRNGDDSAWITVAPSLGGGGVIPPGQLPFSLVTTKTANYTATADDFAILCDASGGPFTVTLPDAAANPGLILFVKKIESSSNDVTVEGDGADEIDNALTFLLDAVNEGGFFVSDGAAWRVISHPGAGAAPLGDAGGVLSGTYPNPGLADDIAIPGDPTTTTQPPGDDSDKVSTTAYADAAADAARAAAEAASIPLAQKGAANGVATLGADSKIPSAQLPLIALTDVFVVASQAAQLALTAEEGDVVVRTDQSKTWIHNGGTAGTMADYTEIVGPDASGLVSSFNGRTGAVNPAADDYAVADITGLEAALDGKAPLVDPALSGDGTLDGDALATEPFVVALLAAFEGAPVLSGAGSPEGVVTAVVGTLYVQTDASPESDGLWYKKTGSGNTGWVQITASDGTGAAAAFVGAEVSKTSQSIPDNTSTTVTFSTEVYDEGGCWSSGQSSRLVAPQDGEYLITVYADWATNTTGKRSVVIRMNGSTQVAGSQVTSSGNPELQQVATVQRMTAGQYAEVRVFQNRGGGTALDLDSCIATITLLNAASGGSVGAVGTQAGSYTLVLGDAGDWVRMNVGSANTLTVPPNSSVAFPVGTEVTVEQMGAGQTTVVAGAGVTIRTPETLKLAKQYAVATLKKVATDEWVLAGYLEAAP